MAHNFLLAGFESSAFVKPCGTRLDMIEATNHAVLAHRDYAGLTALGIKGARDGIRWHLVQANGRYDFSSLEAQIAAANAASVRVIWDLSHYDCPDGIDIWKDEFIEQFADYAAAATLHITRSTPPPHRFCPINEISYWAWAGGDNGLFHPCAQGQGGALKQQLARAFIAAARHIRKACPDAELISAEPLIHIAPDGGPEQYEAMEMVLGLRSPELGGSAELLDVVGVNYYPFNQWRRDGGAIPFGHIDYRALSDLLIESHGRWGKPLMITETAAEGSAKASWLAYVVQEVLRARQHGARINGICLYPIVSFPTWFRNRTSDAGLWSPDIGLNGLRRTDRRLEYAIRDASAKLTFELGQEDARAVLRPQFNRPRRGLKD